MMEDRTRPRIIASRTARLAAAIAILLTMNACCCCVIPLGKRGGQTPRAAVQPRGAPSSAAAVAQSTVP